MSIGLYRGTARACRCAAPVVCDIVGAFAEFTKIATATAIGFAVMGFIGYFVRLLHIPVNNILIGMCCSPGCAFLALLAPGLGALFCFLLDAVEAIAELKSTWQGSWSTWPRIGERRSVLVLLLTPLYWMTCCAPAISKNRCVGHSSFLL